MQRLLRLVLSSWLCLQPLSVLCAVTDSPSPTDTASASSAAPPQAESGNSQTNAESERTSLNKAPTKSARNNASADPATVEVAVDLSKNHAEELKQLKKLLDSPDEQASLKRQLATVDKLKKLDERNRLKESQQNAKLRNTLLKNITEQISLLGEDFNDLGLLLRASPQLLGWSQQQLSNAESRSVWLQAGWQLLLILGLGYLVLLGANLSITPLKRRLEAKHPAGYWHKALTHLSLPLMDLLPVVAFAASTFVLMALIEPDDISRAISLALINASIITRSLLVVLHHLMRQEPVRWRLFNLGRSAIVARRSLQILVPLAVYGYFVLQLGLLLDMPLSLYKILNFSLLLALVLLLIKTIRRQRHLTGATDPANQSPLQGWLSGNWHWLAQCYLLFLPLCWLFGSERGLEWLLTGTGWSLLAIFVYSMLKRALHHVIELRILFDAQRFELLPSLKQRTQRHLRISEYGLTALMLASLLAALLQIWGFDLLSWLQTTKGQQTARTTLVVIAIISLSFICWVLLSNMIESFLVAKNTSNNKAILPPRYRTLLGVARNALFITLLIVAALMILSELGVNIAPLLAGAGVLGLALGFGSQRLVQDMITGVFILLEDQVAVDDVITAGGLTGKVEAISIRTLKLRDVEGRVHIIPFSAITTITNTTRDFSYFVFVIGVAYNEDPDEVCQIIRDVGSELLTLTEIGPKILEPIEVFGVDSFGEMSINIKGRIKTQAGEQFAVSRAFNLHLKRHFDLKDIQIAVPGSLRLIDSPSKLKPSTKPNLAAKDHPGDIAVPVNLDKPAEAPPVTPGKKS